MSILVGKCKKCKETIKLDIGDKSLKEIKKVLSKSPFSCPGHHVELGAAYPKYWYIDEWERQEGKAPTEKEFVAKLKETYKEVVDAQEMNSRNIITSFAAGFPMTNDGNSWDFTQSPSGKRYYYH